MTTVYDSVIEIGLDPVFNNASDRDDKAQRKLDRAYDLYFKPTKDEPKDAMTQERYLVRLFWERASHEHKFARENGYLGSCHNCVFRLLYGVFGVDVIAYLFNQAWVPSTTIDPFRSGLFLERVAVLERAIKELKDGAKTPVRLAETAPYREPGMGPKLKCFREERHRLLLNYSLRELWDFGALGVSLHGGDKDPTVSISIWPPHGDYEQEIMAFAPRPREKRSADDE